MNNTRTRRVGRRTPPIHVTLPGNADPLLCGKILNHLSLKPTDARGYAAIRLDGHTVGDVDDAVGVLHHAGLLNAFYIAHTASPRFHPSSLTGEGRRLHDQRLG